MDRIAWADHARGVTRIVLAALALAIATPRAEAGRGGALLKYVADDAMVVMVVDVAHARGTPMVTKAIETASARLPWWSALAKSGVALDKAIDTIVIGNEDNRFVFVVEGRLDKLVAEIKKASSNVELHAGVAMWTLGDWQLAVVDHHLVVTNSGQLAALIDRSKRKPKAASATRGLLAATSSSADAFGAVDAGLRRAISSVIGGEPESAVFSAAVATRLSVDCTLRFADEATATTVVQRISAGVPIVHDQVEQMIGKDFADSIVVDQDHATVRGSGTLTADEVDKIVSKLTM